MIHRSVTSVLLLMTSACQRDLHELSPYVADQFGSHIFCIQDLDGDGIEEYVVGDTSSTFVPETGPGYLSILSGTTLECVGTIGTPDSLGSVGILLGTYARTSGDLSADRIVTVRWESEGPVVHVRDAQGFVVGRIPIQMSDAGCAFAAADVDADGINDLVLGLPGGPTGADVGGRVHIVDGQGFLPIATLTPESKDVRFGESVAAMLDSTPGAHDTLLISEMQYVERFPLKCRTRITQWDPRSARFEMFHASEELSDGESYRMLPARGDTGFVLARENVLVSRELRSVSAVTSSGALRWHSDCAGLATPDTQRTDSIAVLDDMDGDGLPEALIAMLSLKDDGGGSLYLLSSKAPSSLLDLDHRLLGLGAAIATARDSRTGRIASIAVGACHPIAPYYQGQVILLDSKDMRMQRFARRTGPGHFGVQVGEVDESREH